eukprot:COSAG01_NODE_1195_length_11304_cov_118.555823_7_plen_110_part_00
MACVVAVGHSNKAITVHKFTQLGGLQLEKEARAIVKCVLLRPAMATSPSWRGAGSYPLAVMTGWLTLAGLYSLLPPSLPTAASPSSHRIASQCTAGKACGECCLLGRRA